MEGIGKDGKRKEEKGDERRGGKGKGKEKRKGEGETGGKGLIRAHIL